LTQFEQAIQEGHLLLLLDVPKRRVDEIDALVRRHYADVEIEGPEPTIPAFP
jgi:hypothetical protein